MTLEHLRRAPRVVGIVSARMGSSRYPGKAMVPLAGRPLIQVLLERVAMVPELDSVALATPNRADNRPLVELARGMGIPAFQGEEDDVLKRHIDCARNMDADHVVRVLGDNPLVDLDLMAQLVERHLESGAEYTYIPGHAYLMGTVCDVVSRIALERSWARGEARHRGEDVTLYIKEHPGEFKVQPVKLPDELDRPDFRLTVDEPDDAKLMQTLFDRLAVPGKLVSTRDAIALLDREPELARLNAHLRPKSHELKASELDRKIVML
jgi:spore coat polysaccharide biosynthesis protein SpsF (cytidylyltransferase family)